jgi:peptidoglycan/xylan/chitin deacetylase (PgdA/CDA1 family)
MISITPNGFFPESSFSDFKKQMTFLANYFRVMTLDELVKKAKNRNSVSSCVAITFDDGYKDNYEIAFPILKRYSLPATIFLSTGYIGNQRIPWFLKVRYIFMKSVITEVSFFPIWNDLRIPIKTVEQKYNASSQAINSLKFRSHKERNDLIDGLCFKLGVTEFEDLKGLMLDWNQIQKMDENGITFGAHTVNHPVLSHLPIDLAEYEIRKSKETIEKKLDKPVSTFAYPFGKKSDYDQRIFPLLKKMAFSCALTTEKYPNRPSVNLFELNRHQPWALSLI